MKIKFKFCISLFIILSIFLIWNVLSYKLWDLNIIIRNKRWVDETLRYETNNIFQQILKNYENEQKKLDKLKKINLEKYLEKKQKEYEKKIANDYLQRTFKNQFTIDKKKEYFNWNKLRTPEYIKTKKTSFIIHHTAKSNNNIKTLSDVKKTLLQIYKYHTLTRWRWDIWYNFIIDPFGNIYEWRAWWTWTVWMHTFMNNTPTIWIALMWNFNIEKPTNKQINSLINLISELWYFYWINPLWKTYYHRKYKTYPYVQNLYNYTIIWHKDAWYTSCPWINLENLLPYIRRKVKQKITIKTNSKIIKKWKKQKITYEILKKYIEKLDKIKNTRKIEDKLIPNKNKIKKTQYKINKNEIKNIKNKKISVLLYDLSTKYKKYDINCKKNCYWTINWHTIIIKTWNILINNNDMFFIYKNKKIKSNKIIIYNENDPITIENFNKKSKNWKPLNSFRWKLIFRYNPLYYKGNIIKKYVVINNLNIFDYLKWISETNDNENYQKVKVLALLTKTYTIYYMKNRHPNIPTKSDYQAIDSPLFFQKYVWEWFEWLSYKRKKALIETKNEYIFFDWYIPILPYFHCSKWYTFSAKEKRWRQDTPYLKSVFDFSKCKKFEWHWVWLSWKWANILANLGLNYKEILNYYYKWITIENI